MRVWLLVASQREFLISPAKIEEHHVMMPRSQMNVVSSEVVFCAEPVEITTRTRSPERCLFQQGGNFCQL
jgi:hypothetical protein